MYKYHYKLGHFATLLAVFILILDLMVTFPFVEEFTIKTQLLLTHLMTLSAGVGLLCHYQILHTMVEFGDIEQNDMWVLFTVRAVIIFAMLMLYSSKWYSFDNDWRWVFLSSLAVCGTAGSAQIEHEMAAFCQKKDEEFLKTRNEKTAED